MIENPEPRPAELFHVGFGDGAFMLVEDASNGGFGPVNVWRDGHLVRIASRHRAAEPQDACGLCQSPIPSRFPYRIGKEVSAMVPPGPVLVHGTVVGIEPKQGVGFRVNVETKSNGWHSYNVSSSGACDYLLPYPFEDC